MFEFLASSLLSAQLSKLAVLSFLAFVPIVNRPLHHLPFPLTAAVPALPHTRVILSLVQRLAVVPVVPILIGCYLLGISVVVWLRIKGYFSDDLHDPQSPNSHRCHHSSPAFVMVGMGSSLVNAKCRCKPTQPYSSPPKPNSDLAADQEMDEAHCSPLPPSPPTLVGRLSSGLPSRGKDLWDSLSTLPVTPWVAFLLVILCFLAPHAEWLRIQTQRVTSLKLSFFSDGLMDSFGILGKMLEVLDPLPWLNALPFPELTIQVNLYPNMLLCPPPLPPLPPQWIFGVLAIMAILAFSMKFDNPDSKPGLDYAADTAARITPTIIEMQVEGEAQHEQQDKASRQTSDICEDNLVKGLGVEGDSEPTGDLKVIVNLNGGRTRYGLSSSRIVGKDREEGRDARVQAHDHVHSVSFIGAKDSTSRDAMEGMRDVGGGSDGGQADSGTDLDPLPISTGFVTPAQPSMGPNGSHTSPSPSNRTSYSPACAPPLLTPVCETEEAVVSKDCDEVGALEDELSVAEIAEGLDRLRWAIQKEKEQWERDKGEAMKMKMKKLEGMRGVTRRTKQALGEAQRKGGSNFELIHSEAEEAPVQLRWVGPRATEYQSMYALVESEPSVYRSFSGSTEVQSDIGAESGFGADDVSLDVEALRRLGEDDGKPLLDVDIRELDQTNISLMEVAADDGDGDSLLGLELGSADLEDEDVSQGPISTSTIWGRVADVSFSTLERETADALRAMQKRRSNSKHVPSGRERTIYSSRTAPVIKLTAPTPPRVVLAPLTQDKDGGWTKRKRRMNGR